MVHACCKTDMRRPQVTRRLRRVQREPTGSTREACVIRVHVAHEAIVAKWRADGCSKALRSH
jgi:hypothetical protein